MEKSKNVFSLFLESKRPTKRLVSVVFDATAIIICIYLALKISDVSTKGNLAGLTGGALLTLFGSITVFVKTGFYRAILRFMGLKAVFTIALGILCSTALFTFSSLINGVEIGWIAVFVYWSSTLLSIGGARLLVIALIRLDFKNNKKNVAIYGAGESGRQLGRALSQENGYKIIAYIDDEPALIGSEIDSVKVYSPLSLKRIIEERLIGLVLLAMPSASHSRRSQILAHLEPLPVKVKTMASMDEILSGKVQIGELKEIDIEDLLGRDAIDPNFDLLHKSITNKVVMVTGAGGSIGAELCRQIIALNPSKVILYELSEFALYSIEKEISTIKLKMHEDIDVIPLLGSVQHKNRLLSAMKIYNVQTVFHAAAYKHVPIVEHNIVEGVRNNAFGTWYCAEAAAEAKVERFVLVSTDKAVRPTNVMGASKRLAELVLQAINTRGEDTIFTMVRFGNVLGSSGSVVPLFREQIKQGGPVTVTHKDIIRYFMTIPEAAQLVIQAGSMGKGGDVFVLDMGEQVKISELAERMIHLTGFSVKDQTNPQGDIEIQYSGLRPGEKLFEELLVGENVVGTNHPKIMSASEEQLPWDDMQRALILLSELCDQMDCDGIVQLLLKLPTGYNPQHAVCDLLWDEDKDKNNVVRFKTLS